MRFLEKVAVDHGCWLWTGVLNGRGYPVVRIGRRNYLAQRLSSMHHIGAIPLGLTNDDRCETPRCVYPERLRPLTRRLNIWRA